MPEMRFFPLAQELSPFFASIHQPLGVEYLDVLVNGKGQLLKGQRGDLSSGRLSKTG